ncbi:transposase [Avibacterium paragallinarum]|uniref:transposase n=1 Tax=Avibacterium paragallinarum TaxID=728 RepID=UPI0039889199
MINVTEKPKRKIIRLQHYDYSQIGLYFITVCTHNKECLFGNIENHKMLMNDAGKMIQHWYLELEKKFPNIECLEYIVMPNHIHFILYIKEQLEYSIPTIVQWFKTMTTNNYIKNVKNNHWKPFERKLWQRSYYEHIIRNEKSYLEITEYIECNPYNWSNDSLFRN